MHPALAILAYFSPLLRPLANATLAAVAVAILEEVWIWGSGKFIDGWTALFVLALVLLVEAKRMAPVGRLKLAQ